MTTRQELEKMVEVEVMREFNGTNCTASNRNAFLYGAAFVMDKLMPEIEKLKELVERNGVACEMAVKELTAANERIKELEAEINSLQCECDSGTQCQACFLKEALTPPERGEE